MSRYQPVGDDEVDRALVGSPWRREGSRLVLERRFGGFADAIRFVDAVAALAEAADHHPDIDVRYDLVRLELYSHVTGGLTDRDVDLAGSVAALLS